MNSRFISLIIVAYLMVGAPLNAAEPDPEIGVEPKVVAGASFCSTAFSFLRMRTEKVFYDPDGKELLRTSDMTLVCDQNAGRPKPDRFSLDQDGMTFFLKGMAVGRHHIKAVKSYYMQGTDGAWHEVYLRNGSMYRVDKGGDSFAVELPAHQSLSIHDKSHAYIGDEGFGKIEYADDDAD